MGAVPEQVWFADREGQPVGRPIWADAAESPLFQVPEQPKGRSGCVGGERSPGNVRPTTLAYDEIPDVVSREWWDAHEHLLVFRKDRLCIKASALREGYS